MTGPRAIVLIGLSGAGKSTVARHVADQLGAPWCDLDARIAAEAGKSVAAIFAEHGEARFRALEQAAMLAAVAEAPQVIAAGAGWAAQPGALEAVGPRALVIHLAVDPAIAARRLQGATDRPLLEGGDPASRLRDQWAARLPWYARADIEVAADAGAPELVAAGVVVAARQYGGWTSR